MMTLIADVVRLHQYSDGTAAGSAVPNVAFFAMKSPYSDNSEDLTLASASSVAVMAAVILTPVLPALGRDLREGPQ